MKDEQLERFIRDHREAFDHADPPSHLWTVIRRELEPPAPARVIPFLRRWHYAAAASILILIGAGIGWWFAPRLAPAPDPQYAEFQEAEAYYRQRIAQKVSRLEALDALPGVAPDLEEIAGSIAELKEELDQVPPAHRPELIHSLIRSYQVKLELLERVLNHHESKNAIRHETL